MIDRLMNLPLVPLLLTIALSNTALATVLFMGMYANQPDHFGPVPGADWHGAPAN